MVLAAVIVRSSSCLSLPPVRGRLGSAHAFGRLKGAHVIPLHDWGCCWQSAPTSAPRTSLPPQVTRKRPVRRESAGVANSSLPIKKTLPIGAAGMPACVAVSQRTDPPVWMPAV